MDRNKLRKLRQELEQLRRSPQKPSALQSLATKLGRKLVKRGKEPTWESQILESAWPLSIPDHGGGRDLAPGTKKNILNQLEDDIIALEAMLPPEEEDAGEKND